MSLANSNYCLPMFLQDLHFLPRLHKSSLLVCINRIIACRQTSACAAKCSYSVGYWTCEFLSAIINQLSPNLACKGKAQVAIGNMGWEDSELWFNFGSVFLYCFWL